MSALMFDIVIDWVLRCVDQLRVRKKEYVGH